MVLHVKDEETDMLVRKLAGERRIGLTTAIKEAVTEALSRTRDRGDRSLWEETADIRTMILSRKRTGLVADKAFFDELSGHEESDSGGGDDGVR